MPATSRRHHLGSGRFRARRNDAGRTKISLFSDFSWFAFAATRLLLGRSAGEGRGAVPERDAFLVARVASRLVAIPARDAVESMRPLPIEPLPGAPEGVLGLSIIRGAPVPVVDLASLLGLGSEARSGGRFLTLAVGGRSVAVAVDAVLGVRALERSDLQALAPLFADEVAERIAAIGVRDRALLVVLRSARLLPEGALDERDRGRTP